MAAEVVDVSVVIPCYNASDTLIRCLDSVANQIALPREIILVDDGSDSPVESMVQQWVSLSKIPVRVVRQDNRGAPSARNLGLRLAQSTYVALLDADDAWLPEKLWFQYKFMESRALMISGHGYSYCSSELEDHAATTDMEILRFKVLSKWRFVYGNPFFTPTVMIAKEQFLGFDERFRRVDDYKAWVENFRPGSYGYIDATLATGFKPPIGHSGLSGSIKLMHDGYLQVLKALLKEKKISLPFYVLARMIEGLKFPIRKIRVKSLSAI